MKKLLLIVSIVSPAIHAMEMGQESRMRKEHKAFLSLTDSQERTIPANEQKVQKDKVGTVCCKAAIIGCGAYAYGLLSGATTALVVNAIFCSNNHTK